MSNQVHPALGKAVQKELLCPDITNPFLLNNSTHALGLHQHTRIGKPYRCPPTLAFSSDLSLPTQLQGSVEARAGGALPYMQVMQDLPAGVSVPA